MRKMTFYPFSQKKKMFLFRHYLDGLKNIFLKTQLHTTFENSNDLPFAYMSTAIQLIFINNNSFNFFNMRIVY